MTSFRTTVVCFSILLSLLAASCSTETQVDLGASQGSESAQDNEDDQNRAASTSEPAPTAETDPDPEPEAAAAPTEVPAASPTEEVPTAAAPEGDVDVDTLSGLLFGPRGFDANLSAEELQCASSRLAADTGLLQRVATVPDFDDLSPDDQTALVLLGFDCAPDAVAQEFSNSFADLDSDIAVPASVGECLIERMSSGAPDRRLVIEGFLALGNDSPVPDLSKEPVVDTMVACFPGSLFGQAAAQAALDDPELAGAIDQDCVANSLGGDAMRPLWVAIVESPGSEFDTLPPAAVAPMLDALFGCVSFGQVIAGQALLDGITLSDSTIACIDTGVGDLDLTAMLQSGEGAGDLTGVLLGCLSPDELGAIGG